MSTAVAPLNLTCFKAYDIRGQLGRELDPAIAWRIGRASAQVLNTRRVVLGQDCRASSGALADAVAAALIEAGCEVLDLGLCGTEEVYFATAHLGADAGIMVTASHNPINYNGMKLVRTGSAPLAPSDLAAIRSVAENGVFSAPAPGGKRSDASATRAAYVACVTGFITPSALKPLHVLVNAGNGSAGPTFDAIADSLAAQGAPLRFTRMHHVPDGSFPNGIPNPLLPENQPATADAVRAARADFGVAWDGDFDRCFFFDHLGHFIPGEYVVGLLAEAFLRRHPGATIVHDPRIVLNTLDIVAANGGHAVQARTGHAFIKQVMRDTGAIYGGEMSAHHYFRDFAQCDTGMVPWLMVAELVSARDLPLADLVHDRQRRFPSSGELNFTLPDPKTAMANAVAVYAGEALSRDDTDGVSLTFEDWRFNLRASSTEPLVRLNVESRGNRALVAEKLAEISALLTA